MKQFFNKLSKGTLFRVLWMILSIINTFVSMGDDMPLWYKIVSGIILLAAVVAVAWYNNDFTDAARVGTQITYALKDKQITPDEVQSILSEAEQLTIDKQEGVGHD